MSTQKKYAVDTKSEATTAQIPKDQQSTRVKKTPTNPRQTRVFDSSHSHIVEQPGNLQVHHILPVDPATEAMLIGILGKVLFMGSMNHQATEIILKHMERSFIDAGTVVVQEGELGSTMYLVETGILQVYVNGNFINHIDRGGVFGELGVLYESPRSATVIAETGCCIWTLHRSTLKSIQRLSIDYSNVQYSLILSAIPEIRSGLRYVIWHELYLDTC